MKKYYYLMAGLLCASSLSAQTVHDLMKHSEPTSIVAPARPHSVTDSMKRLEHSSRKLDPIITAVPLSQSSVKALKADTSLLIKITHEEDGVVTNVQHYEYDDYGLLKCVLTGASEDGLHQMKRYTYTIGRFHYWTSCTIERKTEEGWRLESKKERAYNDAGQLVELKEYLWDTYENKLYLRKLQQFDYAHPVVGADGQETYGVCTRNQLFTPFGFIEYSESYAWFDYLKQYIQTEMIDRDEGDKVITHIGEDTLSITRYIENDVFEKESVYYYGNRIGGYIRGYLDDYYDGIDGSYFEKSDEVIEPGYQTAHYYIKTDEGSHLMAELSYKGGNPFRPQNFYRTINMFSLYEFLIEKGVNVTAKCKILNLADENDFYIKRYDLTWLSDGILKEQTSYSDGSGSIQHVLYDDSCYYVGDVTFNADSSYVCTTLFDHTCKLFSPDHQKFCQFARIAKPYPTNVNENLEIAHISFSEDPGLQKLRHLEEPYIDFWWGDRNIIYDLDEQYRISSIKVTPLGVDSVLNEELYFDYVDHGINIKFVHHNNYADCPKIGIEEVVEKYIDHEDGTGSYELTREIEGKLVAKEQKILTPDSLITYYEYDFEADSLVEVGVYCQDKVTQDSLNITTRIERNFDDGKIQNRFKSERYKDEHQDYYASYIWEDSFEGWQGIKKYYRGTSFLNLDINNNLDPVGSYDDTSRYPAAPQAENRADRLYQNHVFESHIDYAWDGVKKDWTITDEDLYLVDSLQNQVKVTHKYTKYADHCERIYTLKVDANHNLESYELVGRDCQQDTGEEKFYVNRKVYYQYDENNRLVERKKEEYDQKNELQYVHVDTYEYGDFSLSPTAIDKVVGKTSLSIHGRSISVDQGASIIVYDSTGRICAEGQNQVTVPRSGNYVVVTQGTTIKVNIQ